MQRALKASLISVQRLGPLPGHVMSDELMLAATQCVALFGGFALHNGLVRMRELQSVLKLALSQMHSQVRDPPSSPLSLSHSP